MSYDTTLHRLTAEQFEEFIANEGHIDGDFLEEDFYRVTDDIPQDTQIRNLIIDEAEHNMFVNTAELGISIFDTVLVEPREYIGHEGFVRPEDVPDLVQDLEAVTDEDLRNLFALKDPDFPVEKYAKVYGHRNVETVLKLQKQYYQIILRFHQQAAESGDAILVRFN